MRKLKEIIIMKNNITLIGMMGSGKTTVSRELSDNLENYKLVDIDNEIEKGTGKKISEIFLKYGEPRFRELESNKIKLFLENDFQIISTGGGAFERIENRNLLLENSQVVYLKAPAEVIFERIKLEVHRPLLRKNFSIEKIKCILELREKNYLKAPHIIDTESKTPYDIVKEIRGVLNV